MLFQVKRCPKCGKIYESGMYREKLGKPIADCIFCGTTFLDKSVNEWELRGIGSKGGYFLSVIFDVLIWGIVSAMIVSLIVLLPDVLFKTNFSHFMINDGNYFIALVVICTIVNLIRIYLRESKDFSASKERMANAQYRETLKSAGLLK
jgi:hypothetical protein